MGLDIYTSMGKWRIQSMLHLNARAMAHLSWEGIQHWTVITSMVSSMN